jgi:hypothetical protein
MVTAPFVDLDTVDLYVVPQPVPGGQGTAAWRTTIDAVYRGTTQMGPDRVTGPALRFISPYDIGVLMYSREEEGIPVVSPIQTYLDLYAKGGRDLKQAEYLLEKVIKPRWQTA